MKKNISINIGGIIFHIEEDGYDRLKGYLDSINRYFSTFEDSKEIIEDIENRIAEIFLSKLSDGNQVIDKENVEELISTMGTTSDFEATIESEPEEKQEDTFEPTEEQAQSEASKRLYRDTNRKILGGVASGIANYFGIDAIWVRLLILALVINVFFAGLSGAAILAYILLWIVIPGNDKLEEDKSVKKLYRNADERVLGGVSSGIASYFGIDPSVIRLLFVLSIFLGGAGLIVYIILWIITPEAKSITEKMQMQGEPVTLSNIEENVKSSLNVKEGEESVFVKILLFPFRFIALIIDALGKLLGPFLHFLVEALRVLFGALIVVAGVAIMLGTIISFTALIGWDTWLPYVRLGDIPLQLIRDSINRFTLIGLFLVSFIPALAISLLGLMIILKRVVARAYIGWSMFALWILGLITLALFLPRTIKQYRTEADYREERIFAVSQEIPTLTLAQSENFSDMDMVDLRLRGHSDTTYSLLLTYQARGENRQDAQENARGVTYQVRQDGSFFYFDEAISFPENTPYHFQQVDAIFYIPFGKVFKMEGELKEILVNTLRLNGYRSYQMDGNEWVFERSGLKCLTCSQGNSPGSSFRRKEKNNRSSDRAKSFHYNHTGNRLFYDFENFDRVKIDASFKVNIREDDEYEIMIVGDEDDLDEIYLSQYGSKLEVKDGHKHWKWWNEDKVRDVTLYIKAPDISSLELTGACKGEFIGFDTKDIQINLTGASEVNADIEPRELDINLTGASKLWLEGKGDNLDVKLVGASTLRALDFEAEYVDISALGASTAFVYANEELDVRALGASTVKYKGTSNVSVVDAGLSNVKRLR